MRFEFATATRIVFGPGTLTEVGPSAARTCSAMPGKIAHSPRALVIAPARAGLADPLFDVLAGSNVEWKSFEVGGEPTVEMVRAATAAAREAGCNLVIGFGGGSVMDTAKAVAAMLTNAGDLIDYLEVIGASQPLSEASAPCITVPTTAGTGAEVTRNAVLACPEHRVKVSLRSPLMLPWLAVVDPRLTHGLPPAETAYTGLDALTQLVEPYVSIRANPLTDGLCREGLARAARSLRRAYEHGDDAVAREDMSLASLFSGLALANAGLGAVHGLAAPLGGMFNAPHGALCAALLPAVMATNIEALRAREPGNVALKRYDEIGRILTGDPQADAEDGVAWVRELCGSLRIPSLRAHGVTEREVDIVVEKASTASSMKGNPVRLTEDELLAIVNKAL